MRALALRRVCMLAHARAQIIQCWQQKGHRAGIGALDEVSGYLSFLALGEHGTWRGLINARDWLHHSLPALPLLLSRECPVASIAQLFRAVPRALALSVDELHYQALSDIELIDASNWLQVELPWLDTSRGRLWFTQLPPACPARPGHPLTAWLDDLALQLDLVLGISHLHHLELLVLSTGDVLRINQRTHQCLLAGRDIGVFTFNEEGIHVELTVTDASEQEVVGLDHLSLRLEFVLATHDIDLGTLRQIIAGQLLPLAVDAAQQIEIRANGKRVARGELVQLDEQLGVELLEVYRNVNDE